MKHQWVSGTFSLVVVPTIIMLVGYYEHALGGHLLSMPSALIFLLASLPGVCIGVGLLALLSIVQSSWPQRTVIAAAYGAIMYSLAETISDPVVKTHAVLLGMP
jgi:hypothetical protein